MPDAVRVLWLVKGLGPGGAERLLVSLAEARDPSAVAYDAAYLLPGKSHLVAPLEAAGVTVRPFAAARAWNPRWLRRLRALVRAERYDVVHVHSPLPGSLARLAVRSLPREQRPAIVSTEHNVWASHRPPTRWLNRLTSRMDDARIAVSEEVRRSMPRGHRDQVDVLVHGVALAAVGARRGEREEARAELGVASGEVVVGTVANLRASKDYPNLLAAARIVLDRVPGVRFLAVGQGPLLQQVADDHRRLELGDRFRLLGYREDALRVLAACDVFVLASRHEGLPVAMLEAMAIGLPVVATAVGGVPSVVRDGVEGRLVAAGDPPALAAALEELVSDGGARARAGRSALARADDFDIRVAARHLERLYRQLAHP